MRTTTLVIAVAAVAAGGLLALRSEDGHTAAEVPVVPAEARYVEAAQDMLRKRLRQAEAPVFGPARVFRFGPADERAVCGTVTPAGGAEAAYVIRLLLPRSANGRPASDAMPAQTVLEQGPGLAHADAGVGQRYCRDGAADAPVRDVQAPAPAPMAEAPAAGGAILASLPPTAEAVAIRSPARLRSAPGGEVLRVAAQGEVLVVYGRAPGGWLQVGTAAPQGWVHGSMVTTAP